MTVENDPNKVQYWDDAKHFAAKGGTCVAKEYADLAGVTTQQFFDFDSEHLCERYKLGLSAFLA